MNQAVGNLYVALGLDSAQFTAGLGRAQGQMGTFAAGLTRVAKQMVGVFGAAFSAREMVRMADGWSDMRSRIGAATKEMDKASAVMGDMLRLANASYSPIEQTVEVFSRNVGVMKDLGFSTKQTIDFTEALNHALVITATRGERAASVQAALAKAMAVGRLQSDGLEAILANGGRIAEALAKELGTTVSGLRDFASRGEITGQVIARALIKPLAQLRKEAGEMPATVGDAFTRLSNNLKAFVGQTDQAFGASALLASGIFLLADNLDLINQGLLVLAATRLPALAISLATATGAAKLFGAALAFTGGPVGLLAAGVTAFGLAIWNQQKSARAYADALREIEKAKQGVNEQLGIYIQSRSEQSRRAILAETAAIIERTRATLIEQQALAEKHSGDWTPIGRNMAEYAKARAAELALELENLRRTVAALSQEKGVEGVTSGIAEGASRVSAAAFRAIPATAELDEQYGKLADSARRVLQAQNDLAIADHRAGLVKTLENARKLTETLRLSIGEAAGLRAAITLIAQDGSLGGQAEAAQRLAAQILEASGGLGKMNPAAREVYEALLEASLRGADLQSQIGQSADATLRWANAMASVGGQLRGIAAILAGLGGGVIDNVSKQVELDALRAGQTSAEARRTAEYTRQDRELEAKGSVLEGKYGKFVGGMMARAEAGVIARGRLLDAELEAEHLAAAERERIASKASGGGGGAAKVSEFEKVLSSLREEVARLNATVGMTDQQAEIWERQRQAGVAAASATGQAIAKLIEERDMLQDLADATKRGEDAFTDLFGSILDGADAALKALASLIAEMAKVQFAKGMLGLLSAAPGGSTLIKAVGGLLGHANGTQNFAGGLTRVNERGGEIMNLPKGTQIIPNDISKRMADGAAKNGGGLVKVVASHDPGILLQVIDERVGSGVRQGLGAYDRQLPNRMQKIGINPRKR